MKILILFCLLLVGGDAFAQKIKTIFYDKEWQGVQAKEFAYHELVYSETSDSHYRNRFVLKYASGEKEGEGEFVKIDPYDFSKSVLGSYQMFYKNGNKLVEYRLKGNTMDFTSYYPNGLIKDLQTYKNGQLDGICYHFTEDGINCYETLYKDGKKLKPYYVCVNKEGYVTKYKHSNNKIFLEAPQISEKLSYDMNGAFYQYYAKNGIFLATSITKIMDYDAAALGHNYYYNLSIIFKNTTNEPIVFRPKQITASILKKDGTKIAGRVVDKKEYTKQVNITQTMAKIGNEMNERNRAREAAYSYSSTNTNFYYSGSSTTGAVSATFGAAVGTGGAAVGAAVGASLSRTAYSGSISSNSTTVSYNGAAAYQANLIAEKRIADYNEQLSMVKKVALNTYLSETIVYPGETISGRVLIDYQKGQSVEIKIPVSGMIYSF